MEDSAPAESLDIRGVITRVRRGRRGALQKGVAGGFSRPGRLLDGFALATRDACGRAGFSGPVEIPIARRIREHRRTWAG